MSSHSHSILFPIVGFCFGTALATTVINIVDEPIRDSTLNEKIVLNSSSDGRYHTCGYITEDGVTEYIQDYIDRCGDDTLAGDTPR
jgi:putative lipoic acid-binding regulatory protein